MGKINKTRYWTGVLYTENMRPDWQECIGDIVQVPYAYCVHDMDTDLQSEHRKDHVHLILAFGNTVAYSHALNVFSLLSAEGKQAINTCQAVINIRSAYNYLIHDTDDCRKKGKHLYSPSCRKVGNGFDIGIFEQFSLADEVRIKNEIRSLIRKQNIFNFAELDFLLMDEYPDEYSEVLAKRSGYFERLLNGNYQKLQWTQKQNLRANIGPILAQNDENRVFDDNEKHTRICPFCGSHEVVKNGKTPANTERMRCKACGKSWVE